MTHAESSLQEIVGKAHISSKSRTIALVLAVPLGLWGAHRFYVGKMGTGIVWLITFGCMGFGWAFDLLTIASGNFKDTDGKRLVNW